MVTEVALEVIDRMPGQMCPHDDCQAVVVSRDMAHDFKWGRFQLAVTCAAGHATKAWALFPPPPPPVGPWYLENVESETA